MAGGCYFFTVNLLNRRSALLVEHVALLRNVVLWVKARHPFTINAMVLLPDHIHALWTLPGGDADFAKRWMLIKSRFSLCINNDDTVSVSRRKKGERGIWQRRYWEHLIRNEKDYLHHVEYIYYNPVKHGHVKNAIEWPYSSLHRDIKNGLVDRDWGSSGIDSNGNYGE